VTDRPVLGAESRARQTRTGPGSLRAAQKAFTRQRLVEAAATVFETKGYVSTTIDDIVGAAGATRATFYLHFSAKAEVASELLAIARQGSAELWLKLTPTVRDGRPREFREWLSLALTYWDEQGPGIRAVRQASVIEPQVQVQVQGDRESAVQAIVSGLEQRERFTPQERQLRGLAAWSLLFHLFDHWIEAGWDFDRDSVLDALTDGWVALLS
jgi:AcrR family transcriptional regulator